MAISAQLITTSATAVTLPSVTSPSIGNAITSIMICNYTPSTSDTVTVYAVPSGQSVGNTYMIVNALPIPGGETVSLDQEKLVLGTGDAIYVKSGSSSTTLTIVVSTLPV
jgi:hypothetical protein